MIVPCQGPAWLVGSTPLFRWRRPRRRAQRPRPPTKASSWVPGALSSRPQSKNGALGARRLQDAYYEGQCRRPQRPPICRSPICRPPICGPTICKPTISKPTISKPPFRRPAQPSLTWQPSRRRPRLWSRPFETKAGAAAMDKGTLRSSAGCHRLRFSRPGRLPGPSRLGSD